MKSIVLSIVIIIFEILILCITTYFLVKDFNKNLKSKKLFETTLFVIFAFLLVTSTFTLVAKEFPVVALFGSVDAWIGFAGSAMGGCITMLALYFTLKTTEERIQKSQIAALKPFIVCHITNLDPITTELLVENFIGPFSFIEWDMRNVSNNIANEIRIVDEFSSIENETGVFERNDHLEDEFGISIHTVLFNDGTFLAPQESNNWKTNFFVEPNEDGSCKFGSNLFVFKHTIIFSFSDISNTTTYRQRFEYTIYIVIGVFSQPCLFLESMGNFMETEDN